MKKFCLSILLFFCLSSAFCQEDPIHTNDTIPELPAEAIPDTVLRIVDLNPFFTLHVDSTLNYRLQINKNPDNYFWFLKNAPVGLRINKETGLVTFKADKSFFLSGKLRYDVPYKVLMGVQNIYEPSERIDTSFTIIFYNTEVTPSRVKPTVSGSIYMEEGETASFKVLCENGNFPVENIITLTSMPISRYGIVQHCGDDFSWTPGYDLVKESDSGRVKVVTIYFIGSNKFGVKDTAQIRIIVRDALNYPQARQEYEQTVRNVNRYVLQLKYTFLQLDKKLKKTKNLRTTFDLTSATTSLTGTVLSTSSGEDAQRTGKILPSVGLALVPIKEASVPNKMVDQNQAALIRTSIKRLEYMVQDNQLVGEKDPDITKKNNKLREELKQVQIQLMEVPVELTNNFTEEELNRYFNSPRVNKKYRLRS
jgi:hypothetical protein